jgi:succinate dehydrogenase/fumarate reductase flavoprotein subunit
VENVSVLQHGFIRLTIAMIFVEIQHTASARGLPVVVVGGGLAGLSAAIEAYHAGGSVILLDKAKNVGGNSAKVYRYITTTYCKTVTAQVAAEPAVEHTTSAH